MCVTEAKLLFGILTDEVTIEVIEVNTDTELTMWSVAPVSTIHVVAEAEQQEDALSSEEGENILPAMWTIAWAANSFVRLECETGSDDGRRARIYWHWAWVNVTEAESSDEDRSKETWCVDPVDVGGLIWGI